MSAAAPEPTGFAFPEAPYPGLRAFEEHEWPIFFGRERFVDIVVGLLAEHGVLLVHGDSGAGKSSLIKAGVAAQLRQTQARAGMSWRLAIVRPGDRPMENLAAGLAQVGSTPQSVDAHALLKVLAFGRDAPAAICRLLGVDNGAPLCVVIDQFEELFEFSRRHGTLEAERIAQLLAAVAEQRPPGLWIILTMRSEYFGHCAAIPGLAEIVGTHQYLLPRMRRDDLLRAMQEPARVCDGELTRALAERMIDDSAGSADQLPLIQHALAYLHARVVPDASGRWSIGLDDWPEGAASLRDLVARQAEDLFAQAVATSGLGADVAASKIEEMFRALTEANSDGHAIRRPLRLDRLAAVVGVDEQTLSALLAPFRAPGASFIAPYGSAPLAAGTRIDISHESLLRSWTRITDPRNGWLAREAKHALLWRSLLDQVRDTTPRGDDGQALAPGVAEERLKWLKARTPAWAERYGGGWDDVTRLVERSVDAWRRKRRRDGMYVAALVIVAALLILSVATARSVFLVAQQDREIAEKDRQADAEREKLLQQALFDNSAAAAEKEQREAEKQVLEARVAELQRKLDAFERTPLTKNSVEQIRKALDDVTGQLDAQPQTQLSARLYVHVAEERQKEILRPMVMALAQRKLLIPEIDVRKGPPVQSELRCFKAAECAGEAVRLLERANALLVTPKLVLQNLSGRYEQSTSIRPRHFEIWFAPGDIQLAETTFEGRRPHRAQ